MDESFGSRALDFYKSLTSPRVPRGVVVMNPYTDARTINCVSGFLARFFSDNDDRVLVFGINPGRFGSGITGVTFTDPVALADNCGIANDLGHRRELSCEYIYRVIEESGGVSDFYRRFFLSAVCPLGFTRDGVNVNYYDDRRLQDVVSPFIVSSIEKHLAIGGRSDHVIILGRGKNAKFFSALNDEHGWFSAVHVLDHPRFIMQYKRRQLPAYIREYIDTLTSINAELAE
ncbi:MAG: uracil-DNA glycosylase family protein [Gemmatimonadaceae bacterium]